MLSWREVVASGEITNWLSVARGDERVAAGIAAAKAAENLLSIKGVDAAFALIRIGGETHISARSNASVSVQLILEKMGGGGHLDSAGARSAGWSRWSTWALPAARYSAAS